MKRNKNAGFTLAETVVAVAVSAVIIMAAGGVLAAGNRMFYHFAEKTRAEELGDAVLEGVADSLRYAKCVWIQDSDMKEAGSHVIEFTEDGNCLMDGLPLYGEYENSGLYTGCRIYAPEPGSDIVGLEIRIEDRFGTVLYRGERYIRFPNLEKRGGRIAWELNGQEADSGDGGVMIFYQNVKLEAPEDES